MKPYLSLVLITYFIIFTEALTAGIRDEAPSEKCATEYKPSKSISNFQFNCSVIMSTFDVLLQSHLGCNRYNYRSLIVRAFEELEHDVSFVCSSNYAITVDVKFADGIVLEEYLNMKWSRNLKNFSDTSTYTYTLQIFPPSLPHNAERGDAIQYTFASVQHPSETIDVLWFSYYMRNNVTDNMVYWMEDKREIEKLSCDTTGEPLYIPCVSPYKIHLEKHSTNTTDTIKYNATNFGVFIDRNANEIDLLGEYSCFNHGFHSSAVNFHIVSLNYSSSYNFHYDYNNAMQTRVAFTTAVKSFIDVVDEYNIRWVSNIIFIDSASVNLKLKCQSEDPKRNLTFGVVKVFANGSLVNLENEVIMTRIIDPVYTQSVICAECTTTELVISETLQYACMDANNDGEFLEAWEIRRNDYWEGHTISYLPRKHKMQCIFPDIEVTDIRFRQSTCQNPLTCKFMEKHLRMNQNADTKFSCFIDEEEKLRQCGVLTLLNKGVVICNVDSKIESNQRFQHSSVYFMGLNHVFYRGTDIEPPKEAILKLETIGTNEKLIANDEPVTFTFHCEAHSFYFEYGFQWFFEFVNGTQQVISSDCISEYINPSPNGIEEEYVNPSSSVNILVSDTHVKRIACAVPRLSVLKMINYREWVFVTANISVYDAMEPTILDSMTPAHSFKIGETHKQIKCYATGVPNPTISWAGMSGQNMSEAIILDLPIYSKSILIFPTYCEKFEGEYKCTASNIVGNVSRILSVRTSSESSHDLRIIGLTTSFLVLLIIIVAKFCWSTRQLKINQSLELENIIKLLNGRSEDADIPLPLQVPFEKSWELEKHSFCIDKNKILGSGEYGIVFKGTIAQLNMDVAFKSLKSTGNMTHLKSLVSELKIMVYIGKHENIVEFVGAYTQEIKKGIVYVANEFCALGSLESYLRSNKGRFQQCPFLASYFEYSNTSNDFKLQPSECSSNHKLKSLLQWCSEISNAMDFLYSKKVVHGDLATRNILLTADWNSKLTDFGLSRRMYNSDNYLKTGQDPLPWRWLALESLLSNVFNVKTDVWAYGITLWEIFSLGEIPYPGISPSMEFVSQLEEGLRNPRPKYASKDLYEVMIACWHLIAEERPSFESLSLLFKNSLKNEDFRLNLKELSSIGSIEIQTIEYYELEAVVSNEKMEICS